MVSFLPALSLAASMLQVRTQPIVTDRPDFTESSELVAVGSLQIESGATYERSGGEYRASGPEVLLRYGASERLEWRLGLPNYTSGDVEGFDDLYLGAKLPLGTYWRFQLAAIPAVFIPVGREGVRSESPAPELKVVWSTEFGENSLSGMVYVSSSEEGGVRLTPVQHTISLGVPVKDRVNAFFEHVLDMQNGSAPQHTFHSGLTFQPVPTRQFDLHFGFGLTKDAPDFFVGLGYSVRR